MQYNSSEFFSDHKISGISYLELNQVDGALDGVITDIINGDACEIRAMEVAMYFIEDAMELYQEAQEVTDDFIHNHGDYRGSMDNACDLMQQSMGKIKSVLSTFHHYPYIVRTADSMHNLLYYYMAYMVIPCISGAQIEISRAKDVSTYFFKNPTTGLIKIGKSSDVKTRKQAVQCGSGVELEVLAIINDDVESDLHKRFSECREHGEWFRDTDGLITACIEKLKNTKG